MQNPTLNRNKSVLDTDRVGRLLVKLATPAFLGLFVQALYDVVNTIFVGQFVGTNGIAGLSVVFPLQFLVTGLGTMVGVGAVSVISRSIGAGDIAGAERAVGNSFTVSVVLSVIAMLAILPFADLWLRAIGASDTVLPYARTYLTIIISGTVFNTLAMALLGLVRAEGNTRVGMTALILGAALSIILCAIFIIWLKMGIAGAGWATVISQIVSMLYLLSYYFTGRSYLKIRTGNFAPDLKILKPMLTIGSASFAQTTGSSLSAMVLIHEVVRCGGDIALSAFGIIQRVMTFASMPAMGIGQALQPILGFNYGARRYRLALKGIYLALGAATVLSVAAFILIYIFPGSITKIFRDDPQLISMVTYAARLATLGMPLMCLVMVNQMIFQAIGKAAQAFIAAIVRPVVFLIPLVLLLSRPLKLDGVFLSLPAADVLSFILAITLLAPILNEIRKAAAKETEDETLSVTPKPILDKAGGSK